MLVAIGAPMFTYHAEGEGDYVPAGLEVFQVTEDPESAASALAGRFDPRQRSRDAHGSACGGQEARRPLRSGAGRPRHGLPASDPLTDSIPAADAGRSLRAPDSVIVEEAPSSRGPMQSYLPILRSDTFYTCSSGGLGHGLPAAVGIALGKPGNESHRR